MVLRLILSLILGACCLSPAAQLPKSVEMALSYFKHDQAAQVWQLLIPKVQQSLDRSSLKLAWTFNPLLGGAPDSMGNPLPSIVPDRWIVPLVKGSKSCDLWLLNHPNGLAGLWIKPSDQSRNSPLPNYVNKAGLAQDTLHIEYKERAIHGILSKPGNAPTRALVILVHGSGPGDENQSLGPNQMFRDLALGLSSRKIACFRYEKVTRSHPDWFSGDFTSQDEYIEPLHALVAYFSQHPEYKTIPLFLAGHSHGGAMVPLYLDQYPKNPIKAWIGLAAPAQPVLTILPMQMNYLAALDGEISDSETRKLDWLKQRIQLLKSQGLSDSLFKTPKILGLPWAYWHQDLKSIPNHAAQRVKKPYLLLFGARDYQVNQRQVKEWRRVKNLHNTPFEYFILEGLNHQLMPGIGRPEPKEYENPNHVAKEVIDLMSEFINKQLDSE